MKKPSTIKLDILINDWVSDKKMTWEDAQYLNMLRAKERHEHEV